jgi:hypothetical protein
MSTKRSRFHPEYETKYKVTNWAEYDRALVRRGDLTVWMSEAAIAAWTPVPNGRRSAQPRYSALAVETALMLRLIYSLPWRQTEGLLNSVLRLLGLQLTAPDHRTLSRRSRNLDTRIEHRATGPVHLIVDSTGLAVIGEGEWANWKHRKGNARRGWRKLHLAVDSDGLILAQERSAANVADVSTVPHLLDRVGDQIDRFTAVGAYDAEAVYEALYARPAEHKDVVLPPPKGSLPGYIPNATWPWRPWAINRIAEVGRREWRRESGYHQQARVENAMFRYKRIGGPRLRAVNEAARKAEAAAGCNALNRMLGLGRARSVRLVPGSRREVEHGERLDPR